MKLGEDLRDIDKISKEEKDKAATELTQKREEDYVQVDARYGKDTEPGVRKGVDRLLVLLLKKLIWPLV